jgi:DNA repair protein RadC
VRRGPTRIDELVATLLPKAPLPAHLPPRLLLDADVVPPAKVADKVLALRELIRSGGRADDLFERRVATSLDVADHYMALLGADTVESFHVVGLDVRHGVRLMQCTARGGVSRCALYPRDALRPIVINGCAALIAVHNHPSGDPSPSAEDIALTDELARGADLLGVRMLDHIIVTAQSHYSFRDSGTMPRLR